MEAYIKFLCYLEKLIEYIASNVNGVSTNPCVVQSLRINISFFLLTTCMMNSYELQK